MAEIRVENAAGKAKTPPKSSVKTVIEPTRHQMREDAANGIFQLIGLGTIFLGQYSDAGAISMHGPNISEEAANLADTNEGMAKGLDALLQVGPYAGIIAVAMPLVMQLLVNHKVIPAAKLAGANVVEPEVLEAQVKTQMMRQAMEAIKAQQNAEQELAEMQAEMMAAQNGANPSE